jgi:hypothetical protein
MAADPDLEQFVMEIDDIYGIAPDLAELSNPDSDSDSETDSMSDDSENRLNSSDITPAIPIPNNGIVNCPQSPPASPNSPGWSNNDLPESAHRWPGYVSPSPEY